VRHHFRHPFSKGPLISVLAVALAAAGAPADGTQAGFQDTQSVASEDAAPGAPQAPSKVEVLPRARDEEIQQRLRDIFRATGWFTSPDVKVDEGVVFVAGRTDKEEYKLWASQLARNTDGVVAVVNRMEVTTPTVWDFSPAWEELESLSRGLVKALPLVVVGLMVMALAAGIAKLATRVLRIFLRRRIRGQLLREVVARAGGILIFLLGLYLVLRVAGLTRLAVTIIGGTGLIGLVVGIAFRDITENFLASLFLSFQHPFREGDLVEVAGTTGYVQRLTSRTTVLMTLDGNQVQIPNTTVFKSSIRNYTSNPNRRDDFVVGIGYDEMIPQAQEIALRILDEHPAVLKDPEPWVLVDSLGSATINLRVYFWLNGKEHSWLKVRSSVIRMIKRAFQDAGISLPDEAREVIFPDGVPVRMIEEIQRTPEVRPASRTASSQPEAVSTVAEGGLRSEAGQIKEQASRSWSPDRGENLLHSAESKPGNSDIDGAARG
jgi:small conductance mechanosensitive channel